MVDQFRQWSQSGAQRGWQWLRQQSGSLGAGLLGALVTYATLAASLPANPSATQSVWMTVATVGGGLLGYLTARAGGYAFRRRNATRNRSQDEDDEEAEAALPVPGMPPLFTPRFTGRREMLHEVRKQVIKSQRVALTGLAGVGKTQLALAFIERWGSRYDIVWWLHADEPAVLLRDFRALAGRLPLPLAGSNESDSVLAAIHAWFDNQSRWLLVFDNAESAAAIAPYLPRRRRGHVLITTRDDRWNTTPTVRVTPWSRKESLEFLARLDHREDVAAGRLAGMLGDLPLALEQALAYMIETATPLTDYLDLLQTRAKELFALGEPVSYEQRVATTWSISIARLRGEAPAAQDLLTLFAFLGPDNIPRRLLLDHPEKLPLRLRRLAKDRLSYLRTIRALGRYSLVTLRSEGINIHRLVQFVTREGLQQRKKRRWAAVAVRTLAAALEALVRDADTHGGVLAGTTLQLHVPYAAHYAQVLGVEKEMAVWLLHELDRMAQNFEQMIHEFDAEGYATYTDDPVLGLPLSSESDIPRLPVMLVEPKRILSVQEEGRGLIMELEAAIQGGMHRFNYGVAVLRPALGWKLRPTPSGLDLVDDQGGGWAHCPINVDQKWVESAKAAGNVLVLYGPRLGVRRPPSHKGPYGQAEKRRELIEARKSGIVVAGFVEWGSTDQWIALPDGPRYRPYADAMPEVIRGLRKGRAGDPTLSAAMPYFALRSLGSPQAALTVEPIAELEAPRCEVQADFQLLKRRGIRNIDRDSLSQPPALERWFLEIGSDLVVKDGDGADVIRMDGKWLPPDWRAAVINDLACAIFIGWNLWAVDPFVSTSRQMAIERACAAQLLLGGVVPVRSTS